MNYTKISIRSLLMRWRQYFSLFLVCAVGVGVSIFFLFLVDGMLGALTSKAKIYYAGDFQFHGARWGGLGGFDYDETIEKLKTVFPSQCVYAKRYDYDASENSALIFEGITARQKIIKGVDFEQEEKLFSHFNMVSGSWQNLKGTNGILVSEPIAEKLGANVGDSITLLMKTVDGYTNTVPVVIGGIFRDSSVFGMYTTYMDREFLCDTYSIPRSSVNRLGIHFPEEEDVQKLAPVYQKELEKLFNMYPLMEDKNKYYNEMWGFEDFVYALVPLSANMTELKIIIDAMKIITTFIIIALVVIIVIGISSTYRVIAMKRINEIGIYKAIGMKRGSVRGLLAVETVFLLVAGCVCGLVLCGLLCFVINKIDFTFIPAFDVFLSGGHVVPVVNLGAVAIVFAVVLGATLAAVLFSVNKAVKITPVQALATTE
ncbi:MAG: FtsX-like permease family protein [Treponema sp.]|nr:FtsX-like permease family protein [Treponema sp.]